MILNYFNQRMPQQHEGKVAEMQNQVHMIAVCRFSGAAEGQVNNIVATPGTCTTPAPLTSIPGTLARPGEAVIGVLLPHLFRALVQLNHRRLDQ